MREMDKHIQMKPYEIVNVMRRALSCIDARLLNHGERVAYILLRMYNEQPDPAIDWEKLLLLGALHDIGAYKTDEIADMLVYETVDVHHHADYGYLFVKYMTQLRPYANAIRYHHTDYQYLKNRHISCANYAEWLFVADRIDILLQHEGPTDDFSHLLENAGTRFDPRLVNLFLKANRNGDVVKALFDGRYARTIDDCVRHMNVPSEEIFGYLKMLVYTNDFRSPYTVAHTINTTSVSMALGRLMGLPDQRLQALYCGAFLHDIGKLTVPIEILESPGRLTEEQMAVMRTHAEQTEVMIRGLVSNEICDIACRHHEKLNGKGYPRGLTAEQLTIPQRIVAVSDVVSALSGVRSYKDAFSKEKTLEIVGEMRDRGELCPRVCEVLFAHYDDIMHKTAIQRDPVMQMYRAMHREYEQMQAEREATETLSAGDGVTRRDDDAVLVK